MGSGGLVRSGWRLGSIHFPEEAVPGGGGVSCGPTDGVGPGEDIETFVGVLAGDPDEDFGRGNIPGNREGVGSGVALVVAEDGEGEGLAGRESGPGMKLDDEIGTFAGGFIGAKDEAVTGMFTSGKEFAEVLEILCGEVANVGEADVFR